MLWVNLIMDTFAALALATEPPSEDLLNDKPHSKKDSIVTSVMWRNIIGQSIF
jgi:magnesium-transporting ATPase (P-type)